MSFPQANCFGAQMDDEELQALYIAFYRPKSCPRGSECFDLNNQNEFERLSRTEKHEFFHLAFDKIMDACGFKQSEPYECGECKQIIGNMRPRRPDFPGQVDSSNEDMLCSWESLTIEEKIEALS